MWRISALDRDGREIGRCELTSGELTIGREADRHLVLPSPSVSRRHARVVIEGGQLRIIDEGSSNGVVVNGARISGPTVVGAQSQIEIAEFRIGIELLGEAEPKPKPKIDRPLRLVGEGGTFDRRTFDVREGVTQVGRALDNELVFEDPSLSRRHARLLRSGAQLDVEDLGSSNGTFVNNHRVHRSQVAGGDLLRFGDVGFRVEGGVPGRARPNPMAALPRSRFYAIVFGGGFTALLVLVAIVLLIRRVPPTQAAAALAIGKITKQAELHLGRGRALFHERKFSEAKLELDQAYDLDPGSSELRRLRRLVARGPEDERSYREGLGQLAIGERKELERALRSYDEISDGAFQRTLLSEKLSSQLLRFGEESCGRRQWSECAWALCRAYEIAPSDQRPSARHDKLMHEAEKKLARDKSYTRCRAASL